MRYLFATAVLAFSIAGSSISALAAPSAASALPATTATSASSATAAQTDGPGTPVDSPDVAQWTAQLVHEQKAAAVHHVIAPHALSRFASRILARTTTIAKNLTHAALRFLGTPYVFGGTSTLGFDCSGYTQHVFAMLGISIPRTADAQYYAGNRIKGGMKAGDLVFFQTYEPGPSHVGIYLGNGEFVHASSHGVMVSHLSDSYWQSRYLGAKRFIASR